MGRLLDALKKTGGLATVATVATFGPDSDEVSQSRKSRRGGDSVREILRAACAAGSVDPDLVFAHLDDEDLVAYVDEPRLRDTAFAQCVARAVRDAALRGTCSCDRCKARRRGGAQ